MNKIYIENSLEKLKQIMASEDHIFIIADENLRSYRNLFYLYDILWIETSEKMKTMDSVLEISKELLSRNVDRDTLLIGIGGGIISDIVGFTACIYKRGIRSAFVPTTLLAQTDAAIGGKNGVNLDNYKNILGTINFPQWIYICPLFFKTLPSREFNAGIAEVIKTMMISGYKDYRKTADYFINFKDKVHSSTFSIDDYFDTTELTAIIKKCVKVKMKIVRRDAKEKGERRILNFGHSFAHAIEKLYADNNNDKLLHGEAVSAGLVMASRYACNCGMIDRRLLDTLMDDLNKIGLPIEFPDINTEDIISVMAKDKKVFGDNIHLILPQTDEDDIIIKDVLVPLDGLDPKKIND